MKSFLLFLFLIPSTLLCQSNHQYWEWAKSFGGTGDDRAIDIKIKNGYLYVCGTFTSSGITWENTTLTNNGGRDFFIAKLDTSGNTIWAKNFGGSADDSLSQMEINDNETIVIKCSSRSATINLGTITLNNPVNFYITIDKNGNVLHANTLLPLSKYYDIDIDDDGGVYISAKYDTLFTFAGAIPDTTGGCSLRNGNDAGAVLLKYNADGSEGWMKDFRSVSTINLAIEYDDSNNSIVALYSYDGCGYFEDSLYFPGSIDMSLISGISTEGVTQYAHNFISGGGKFGDIDISSFEIGDAGPGYVSNSYYLGLGGPYYSLSLHAFRKGTIISTTYGGAGPFGTDDNVNFNFSTLTTINSGNFLLNGAGGYAESAVNILDSNFNLLARSPIPEMSLMWLNNRTSSTSNALYFADGFSVDSLLINKSVPGASIFTLYNEGMQDIFIGKYRSLGYLPLALKPFQDKFKFCDGITSVELDSASMFRNPGAGNLSYRWQPAANFEQPNSLKTKVIMSSDSLVSLLTITDARGDTVSKQILFYNGIRSDVKLKISDTSVCHGTYLSVSLEGTLFDECNFFNRCGGVPVQFNSLSEIKSVFICSPSVNSFSLKSGSLKYCYDTTSVNFAVNPYYDIDQSKFICSGSRYVFPDSTVMENIIEDTRYFSFLKTVIGCDSLIRTYLSIVRPYSVSENVTVCAGSSYMFPDSVTVIDVQTDTNHISTLKAAGGCDSIYINTQLTVNSSYSQSVNETICTGSDYTFPDNVTITDIQNAVTHTSHLTTMNGCDSTIITNLLVTPVFSQTENINLCAGSSYIFPDNVIINNVQADITHTSQLTTINGCDSIIVTHISVLPTFSQSENITLCKGSNYTFPDNHTISNIQSSVTYVSYITAISGCDSVVTTTINVTRLDTSITKEKNTLNANLIGAAYGWLDCIANTTVPNETGQSFIATLIGSYAVQLLKDGCTDTSSCYPITYDDLRRGNRSQVNVYPVPAKNIVTIVYLTDVQTILSASIHDAFGKIVLSKNTQLVPGVNTIHLNILSLQRGVYTISLLDISKQEKTIKRIVVN
jgi:hypothetical protein